MTPFDLEQSLRIAIEEEQQRNGEDHMNVAYRLIDLSKYLASQKRLKEAEPLMSEAVFVAVCNTLRACIRKPTADAASMIEGYEILLKVLGVGQQERTARLRAATNRALAKVSDGHYVQ